MAFPPFLIKNRNSSPPLCARSLSLPSPFSFSSSSPLWLSLSLSKTLNHFYVLHLLFSLDPRSSSRSEGVRAVRIFLFSGGGWVFPATWKAGKGKVWFFLWFFLWLFFLQLHNIFSLAPLPFSVRPASCGGFPATVVLFSGEGVVVEGGW